VTCPHFPFNREYDIQAPERSPFDRARRHREGGHGPAVAVRPGLYQLVVLYPYDGWYGKDEAGNFQPAAVEEVWVQSRSIHLRVTLWAAAIDRK